jgi:hypothetical protein
MTIHLNKNSLVVAIVAVIALVLGVVGVLPAVSQTAGNGDQVADTAELTANLATVTESISYQGRLTDNNGAPLTGSYTMRFFLYEAPSGGTAIYDSGNLNVNVSDGLFTVPLPIPQGNFDGQGLWLSIIVGGQTLSPRQPIRPAPYAMSLRPGAEIRQAATGTAVRVESTQGIGLQGTGQVYGVYGTNSGSTQGSGYGGYFQSTTGIGVYGQSNALPSANNTYTPGVHGHSQQGVGVYGTSGAAFGVAVFGNMATGTALYGSSFTSAFDGGGGGDGVVGVGRAHGVRGIATGDAQGSGYGGHFSSSTGIGVYGQSTANPTSQNHFAPGVFGFSQNGAGVMGRGGGPGSAAGYFDGSVIVTGNLTVSGSKSGYVVDIARNDGAEPLTQGDLVIVTGVTDPVVGNIPVPLVRKADSAASTAVIGVVDAAYQPEGTAAGPTGRTDATGAINSGDYLTIVTLGAFATIKVDASYGAVQPGDLLVSSPTPGHAMRADNPALGTVIGKALAPLDEGTGTVAIMVTMQ